MSARTILIVFAVGIALIVAVVFAGISATRSALDLGDLPPNFDFRGREITAARRAIIPELEAQLEAVERRSGIEHIGPLGRLDRCEAGQSNFTTRDTNAYMCRIEIVQVMPVRGPFRSAASLLGEALLEGDCPDGTDTDRELAKPFDDVQDVNQTSGDCTPGLFDPAPVINGWLPAHPSADELSRATRALPPTCWPWSSAIAARRPCWISASLSRPPRPAPPTWRS